MTDELGLIARDLSDLLGRPVTIVEPIPESHSGHTYRVATGDGRYVLRLPPPGARPRGPADVERQGRIMVALAAAALPVPPVVASGPGGVAGRDFVLMEECAGDRIEQALASTDGATLVGAAFEVLGRIHRLEPVATGIGDERAVGPADEVARWSRLGERARAERPEGIERLEARLLRTLPDGGPPRLVHGDYHLGNLLFASGRVTAVLDWEIAGLGPSLLDDATQCLAPVRRAFGEPNPAGDAGLTLEEILAARGGAPPDFAWYLAATCHKYAAILAYNLRLHRTGRRIDPVYEQLLGTISGLVAEGQRFLD